MAKKKIAISSKTPGRTQLINFYDFKYFRLVDLPGYGYAHVSKDRKTELMSYIDSYISTRRNVFGIFQVCDIGVITNDDKNASSYIQDKFANHFVILNKIDKVSKNNINRRIDEVCEYLNVKKENIILVSAKKNIGIKQIFNKIEVLNKK
jgi:GTP-binding protein